MRGFGGPVLCRSNRPLQISSCSAHQRLAEISCQQQGEAAAESPNSAITIPPSALRRPISPDRSSEQRHMETISDMHTRTPEKVFFCLFAALKAVIKNKLCQIGTCPPRGQLRFCFFFWGGGAKQIHSHSAADTYRSNTHIQFSH